MRIEGSTSSNAPQSFPPAPFNAAKSGLARGSSISAGFGVEGKQMPTASARSMNAESISWSGMRPGFEQDALYVAQGSFFGCERTGGYENKCPDMFSSENEADQGQATAGAMNGENDPPMEPFVVRDVSSELSPWAQVSYG